MKVRWGLFLALLLICCHLKAQTGIGTTTPHNSAKLDISSTDKGFLPPRMTSAQTEAMAVYNLAGVQVTCTQVSVVTTNAAETYKLSVWTQAGAGNFNAINDGNGRSKVLWEKLN